MCWLNDPSTTAARCQPRIRHLGSIVSALWKIDRGDAGPLVIKRERSYQPPFGMRSTKSAVCSWWKPLLFELFDGLLPPWVVTKINESIRQIVGPFPWSTSDVVVRLVCLIVSAFDRRWKLCAWCFTPRERFYSFCLVIVAHSALQIWSMHKLCRPIYSYYKNRQTFTCFHFNPFSPSRVNSGALYVKNLSSPSDSSALNTLTI